MLSFKRILLLCYLPLFLVESSKEKLVKRLSVNLRTFVCIICDKGLIPAFIGLISTFVFLLLLILYTCRIISLAIAISYFSFGLFNCPFAIFVALLVVHESVPFSLSFINALFFPLFTLFISFVGQGVCPRDC